MAAMAQAVTPRQVQRGRMFSGCVPGLPPKLSAIPFQHENWFRDTFGLSESETTILAKMCAARVCGHPGLTVAELNNTTGYACSAAMRHIQRKGLIELVGKEDLFKIWRATERGLRHLGFKNWKPELKAEEQARWMEAES
jgi:hypothetical protein